MCRGTVNNLTILRFTEVIEREVASRFDIRQVVQTTGVWNRPLAKNWL